MMKRVNGNVKLLVDILVILICMSSIVPIYVETENKSGQIRYRACYPTKRQKLNAKGSRYSRYVIHQYGKSIPISIPISHIDERLK